MMTELRDLYQEVILDHYKKPRNFREIDAPQRRAEGYNPLCGDKVTVTLNLDGDRITDVAFQGEGCAISTASASLMTEALRGRTPEEAERLFERFHDVVTGEDGGGPEGPPLGKLEVLAGVRDFPIRVKCATLAWHTLRAALADSGETVCTE
jgi:nitrogen fixation NifU-like protein